MNFDLMSSLIGFLLGTATGASGKYFADKYTDKRKESEFKKIQKHRFLDMKKHMPELIEEFKNDLSKKDQKLIRDFFLFESKNEPGHKMFQYGNSHFRYYEEDHKDLKCKIDLLKSNGLIEDITTKNVPHYKMTEKFVELVIKYG